MRKIKLIALLLAIVPAVSFRDHNKNHLSMVGKWGIYHTVYTENNKSVASTCNVCPQVIFKTDNTANLTDEHGKTFRLKWHQKSDTLQIENTINVSQMILEENNYLIHIKDTTEHYVEIELIMMNRGEKKILRKKI